MRDATHTKTWWTVEFVQYERIELYIYHIFAWQRCLRCRLGEPAGPIWFAKSGPLLRAYNAMISDGAACAAM